MLPSIDIIIPANDRWRIPYLKLCLLSISRQNYPKDLYRTIVVHTNRKSSALDDVLDIALLCQEFESSIVFIKQDDPAYNISKAYNYGARAGSSDAVACFDCDVYFHPDTLKYAAKALLMIKSAVVPVVRSKHHPGSSIFDDIEQKANSALEWEKIVKNVGWPRDANGNAVFPRKYYEKIHGYNESYYGWGGADNDIVSRMALTIGCIDTIDIGCPKSIHMTHRDRPSKESEFTKRNRSIMVQPSGIVKNPEKWGGIRSRNEERAEIKMLKQNKDHVPYNRTFGSVVAQHASFTYEFIDQVIRDSNVKRIVELGTYKGALSLYLGVCGKQNGLPVYTLDTEPSMSTNTMSTLQALGVFFFRVNVFGDVGKVCIKSLISDEPIYLICDNGNKVAELAIYGAMLPAGSMVSVHDWTHEVHPEEVEGIVEDLKLQPYKEELWLKDNLRMATWLVPDRGQGATDFYGTSVDWRRGTEETWHRDSVGGNFFQMGTSMLELLKSNGLTEDSVLLDVGCGSLRLGVHAIDYLKRGHYFGLDCDKEMVLAGINKELSAKTKNEKNPTFAIDKYFDLSKFGVVEFDYAIAQSVWTHLPPTGIELCLKNVYEKLKPGGVFLASYNLAEENNFPKFGYVYPEMTRYPVYYFETLARKYNLGFNHIGKWGIPQNSQNDQLMLLFKKITRSPVAGDLRGG